MDNGKYYVVDKEGTHQEFHRHVDLLRHIYYNSVLDTGRFIILDNNFERVSSCQLKKDLVWFEENIWELNRDHTRRHRRKYAWWRLPFTFRKGPVPGIHNSNRYGRYFRSPKTNNERRSCCREDYAYIRPKRRANRLPTIWDDVYRGDLLCGRCVSWKRQKKRKQWM